VLVPGPSFSVLPTTDSTGYTELFERVDHATAHSLDHVGGEQVHADWSAQLVNAGFTDLGTRDSVFAVDAPLDTIHREWLLSHLRRVRMIAVERLDSADIEVIDDLLDASSPTGIAIRPDALIHTSRRPYAARA